MSKPTVFFSHSSRDKQTLTLLKDMVVEKTGGSIDIFLSSDGQSIPLGHNWVHRIQEALEEAKLMFVFISPNALRSNWIFFESGFAYAKKISVVPVGILGVDLGALSPPLSLLQGFNITSADGLNNIIALFNETFSHKHSGRFSDAEFRQLAPREISHEDSVLGEYTALVNEITTQMGEDSLDCSLSEAKVRIADLLQEQGISPLLDKERIYAGGISLFFSASTLEIKIAPQLTAVTFPFVDKILASIRDAGTKGVSFVLRFIPQVQCLAGPFNMHKITARLHGTSIELGEATSFIWEQIHFTSQLSDPRRFWVPVSSRSHIPQPQRPRPYASLHISCDSAELAQVRILSLLQILFAREVFYIEDQSGTSGYDL